MPATPVFDINRFLTSNPLSDRYGKQIARLAGAGRDVSCIKETVSEALDNLAKAGNSAFVIYGEPQSGKTEMMICLTAKLLDEGRGIIVHLMNDSVDLLGQNIRRFRQSALAPSPITSAEAVQRTHLGSEEIIFCKKNAKDLEKLIPRLNGYNNIVVIDDEADYASPNSAINANDRTAINNLVTQLIGGTGAYLGVTATPARLHLNHTFDNDSSQWVQFRAYPGYNGQDTFFPIDLSSLPYRLTRLKNGGSPDEATTAIIRFMVTAAYLNLSAGSDKFYSMLIHTSGKNVEHEADRDTVREVIEDLRDVSSSRYPKLLEQVFNVAVELYPSADPNEITEYVRERIHTASLIVINGKADRKALGEEPAKPRAPFTFLVGGNIVSRGVTFDDLLSMFFTRDAKTKLQQDTYIQRARMFGNRNAYLGHFELSIPPALFSDWHRCFVFHRLALSTIKSNLGSPYWIGDSRIAVASAASIDQATLSIDKGEMSFAMFDFDPELDKIVLAGPTSFATAVKIQEKVGQQAFPLFLTEFLEKHATTHGSLAIHTSSLVSRYADKSVVTEIRRKGGLMGASTLEPKKFPSAQYHIKVFKNPDGKARVYFKIPSAEFMSDRRFK